MILAGDCDTILLAAGLSTRMKQSKMLREIDGRPLVRVAVEHALAATRRVILVVGHDAAAVRAAVTDAEGAATTDGGRPAAPGVEGTRPGEPRAGRARPESSRLIVVENPHYQEGMFGSIQVGMRLVESEWFFVVPGDLPALSAGVFESVARGADDEPFSDDRRGATATDETPPGPRRGDAREEAPRSLAVVPYYRGTRGHPVLVHRSLIPRLCAEPRSAGPMRRLLARYPIVHAHLQDPAITMDLDTEHDYRGYTKGDERDQ